MIVLRLVNEICTRGSPLEGPATSKTTSLGVACESQIVQEPLGWIPSVCISQRPEEPNTQRAEPLPVQSLEPLGVVCTKPDFPAPTADILSLGTRCGVLRPRLRVCPVPISRTLSGEGIHPRTCSSNMFPVVSAQCAFSFGCWLPCVTTLLCDLSPTSLAQGAHFFGCRLWFSALQGRSPCNSVAYHYSVPNTGIGGSGAWTEVVEQHHQLHLTSTSKVIDPCPPRSLGYPRQLDVRTVAITQPATYMSMSCLVWHLLLPLCCISEVFFRSFLLLFFIMLLQAWYWPLPGKATPLGRILGMPLHVPLCPMRALTVGTPQRPILSWAPPPQKQRPKSKNFRAPLPKCSRPWCRILLYLAGVSSFPTCVWAVPEEARPLVQVMWQNTVLDQPAALNALHPEQLDESWGSQAEGATTDLPQEYKLQDRFATGWLGVTVFAPYYPTAAFGMMLGPCSTFSQVCTFLRASGRIPCEQHEEIVPVHPQLHPGSLSVISFPAVIAQGRRPHSAVLLDLTRVGGSAYATTLPSDARLSDLWLEAGRHMCVDVESEPVAVWVGDASVPASTTGTLNIAHGTLITVYKAEASPTTAPRAYYAADLLRSNADWTRIEHMPRAQAAHCLAVCCGRRIDPVMLAFFPRFYKHEIALKVTKLSAEQADVVVIDNEPPIELWGEPCSQTAVVIHKEDGPVRYFLDTRPIGVIPRLVLTDKPLPDLPEILAAADIQLPDGLCGETLSSAFYDSVQVLRIGCTQDLASKIFAKDWTVTLDEERPLFAETASWPAQSPHACAQVAPDPLNNPGNPQRFGQEANPPTAHEALGLVDEEDVTDELGEFIHFAQTVFVVFAPRYVPEFCHLTLPTDCSVEDALHAVADKRDSATCICFPCLLPVEPQPSTNFACVVATPVWAAPGICLIDGRHINQSIFAQHLAGRLNRTSVLLHLGHATDADVQIYFEGRALVDNVLYEFPTGSLLVLAPSQDPLLPTGTLQGMLADHTCWDPSDPFLHATSQANFLLLSDGMHDVVGVDVDSTDTTAEFKKIAAAIFRYDPEKITTCPSNPRIRDCALLGQVCAAVVVTTEAISRIPVPPGRYIPVRCIAVLDQRPLLKDMSWVLAVHGIINLDRLLSDYADSVPFGHSVSLTGGQKEVRATRTLLKVAHGEVLTLSYVEDQPTTVGPSHNTSGDHLEDSDSETSQSDDPSSRGDSVLRSPTTPNGASATKDRSRTPRRGPPPPSPIHGLSVTLTSLAIVPYFQPAVTLVSAHYGSDFGRELHAELPLALTVNVSTAAQGYEPAFSPNGSDTRCVTALGRQCRFLTEPTGSTPAETDHLNHLRSLTTSLGGTWLAGDRRPLPVDLLQTNEANQPQVVGATEHLQDIGVAVLKVDYAPELLTIRLALPATPEEAERATQEVRAPAPCQHFPHILPVLPQPNLGIICYMAFPAWSPNSQCICMDTIAIDGRLFAAIVPEYVTRQELLVLAGVDVFPEVHVWIGPGPALLEDEGYVHAYPGMLASFRLVDRDRTEIMKDCTPLVSSFYFLTAGTRHQFGLNLALVRHTFSCIKDRQF